MKSTYSSSEKAEVLSLEKFKDNKTNFADEEES